jgi:diguanylate cyclase (GGDEF)-like protein/PAS domain S-box-containing protein
VAKKSGIAASVYNHALDAVKRPRFYPNSTMNPDSPTLSALGDDPLLDGVLRALADSLIVLDVARWELIELSHNLLPRLGYSPDDVELTLEWLLSHLRPSEFFTRDQIEARVAAMGTAPLAEQQIAMQHRDGSLHHFMARYLLLGGSAVPNAGPVVLVLLRDIHEQMLAERELSLIAQVFANSLEGILITDSQGLIVRVNRAFGEITGYTEAEVIGQKPSMLRSGLDEDTLFERIRPRLLAGGHWQGELVNRRRDGSTFPASVSISAVLGGEGGIIGLITSFRDISDSKSSEERIRHLAYFDPLTALPNRSLFNDRLQQEMQRAQRGNRLVALLFLDLDRFKEVNDSMGHGVGDQLLQQVAERLQRCVRADDTVARMGGDEFTIILGDLPSRARAIGAATSVSEKIMLELTQPFLLAGRELFLSTSIGIALCPYDGEEAPLLLRNADTAMYHAKERGKNNFQFYAESMNARSAERLDLQSAMHRAVIAEQFELRYQPIVSIREQRLLGCEVLLRWRHPVKGLIAPNDFVPIAEESGLIVPIGAWVLERACRQFADWLRDGLALERLAVNLSARQFSEGDLAGKVIHALDSARLRSSYLELELTESILMDDIGHSLGQLQDLSAMGVRIAIDDFGTGYSSLSYLKQFPLDCLKIDRSFVRELDDEADQRIVQAIVALARSFRLEVLAEGVESPAQLAALTRLGCDNAQGFHFSQPLTAAEFEEFCRGWNDAPATSYEI